MNDCCVFQFSCQRASTLRREHFRPVSLLLMHFIAASNGFASRYISSMHEYQRTAEKKERNRGNERIHGRIGTFHFISLSHSLEFLLFIWQSTAIRWFKNIIKPWIITFIDIAYLFIICRRKLSNCYFIRMFNEHAYRNFVSEREKEN